MSLSESGSIRECRLLTQENTEEIFTPSEGSISQIPSLGELLCVTNQRVIAFGNDQKVGQFRSALLTDILGISVKSIGRQRRDLYQGLSTVLAGILVYLILGYVTEQVIVASLLAAGVMVLGFLSIIRYFVSGTGGLIIFQVGSWEIEFPYLSEDGRKHLPNLIHTFFRLKIAGSPDSEYDTISMHDGNPDGQIINEDSKPYYDLGGPPEDSLATPTTTQDSHLNQDRLEDHGTDGSSHTPRS